MVSLWARATRQFPIKLFRHSTDVWGPFEGCYEISGNGLWSWETTPEAALDAAAETVADTEFPLDTE